jgi:DNA-binding transcriptional LysR family regulator
MIDIKRLRQLIAVDEAGTFSSAALKVNVSQSAVTKSVAATEAELGFAVFERKSRGILATPEGREFIDRAKRIVGELNNLLSDVRDEASRTANQLRIGICPPAISAFLSEPLASLVKVRPDVHLHVSAVSIEQALRFLKRGDFDLLVGPSELLRIEAELATIPVGFFEARLFVRKGHPLANRSQLTRSELREFAIVAPDAPALLTSYAAALKSIYGTGEISRNNMVSVVDHFSLVSTIVRNSDRLGIVGGGYHNAPGFTRHFALLDLDVFPPMAMAVATPVAAEGKPLTKELTKLLLRHWESPD